MISAHRRGRSNMSETTCHMSISLDGFVAGPDQSLEHPLGVAVSSCITGTSTSRCMTPTPAHATAAAPTRRVRDGTQHVRADSRSVAGDWRGWWGDEPPYHAPVFVLTHYAHEPIEMAGGTTFYFVTDGFDAAFARAWRPRVIGASTSPAAHRPCARRSLPA